MATRQLHSVLYVDDDPDICEVVQASLSLVAGLTVHTAGSGERALVLAVELRPDLILMDVMMPGLDGPSTLKRIREGEPPSDVPVIFLTAKVLPTEVARLRRLGTIGVIAKPFNPLHLGDAVVALWNQRDAAGQGVISRSFPPPVEARERSVAERYLERARVEVIELRKMIDRAHAGDTTVLAEIARLAHAFHGGGALFGFPALSRSGGAIENLLELATANASLADSAIYPGVLKRLLYRSKRLAQEVERATEGRPNRGAMLGGRL